VARSQATALEDFLHTLIPAHLVRRQARQLDVLQRQRKIDPYALLLSVVFAMAGRGSYSVAAARRSLAVRTGVRVVRSAMFDRFTPEFEKLLDWLLDRLLERAQRREVSPQGMLGGFKDVVIVDGTVVKVPDELASTWPGTRRNSAKASVKIHTWLRPLTGELLRYRLSAGNRWDGHFFGVTWADAGKLFLLDMGYASASLWWRIHRVGGFFVTRLPASFEPVVLHEHRRHRGRARKLVGCRLRPELVTLKRSVVDVSCPFRVRVRRYGSKRGRRLVQPFRVIALRNDTTGLYHLYATNLPPDRMKAENVDALYRLRWEVETLFKTAKSGNGLAEISSTKPHIVRIFLKAALLRLTLSMQARQLAEAQLPHTAWINQGAWNLVWRAVLGEVVLAVLRRGGQGFTPEWEDLAVLARDDQVGRVPLRQALLFANAHEACFFR